MKPRDTATLARELALYKGLAEASARINAITDAEALIPAILEVAQRVLRAEASSLFLHDAATGDLVLRAAHGPKGPALLDGQLIVPKGKGVSGWVFEKGRSLLVPDAYKDPRFYREADRRSGFRTRSILCVPLHQGPRKIGVLQLLNPKKRAAFDTIDKKACEAYAALAATAILKQRALEEERIQAVLHRELELAASIQRSLLPSELPTHPKIAFDVRYQPARLVGGDFYDAGISPDGSLHFLIADVSGKGMPAAIQMAQAISLLRALRESSANPEILMGAWNRRLCEALAGSFLTAILGTACPRTREVYFSVAGHAPPWILARAGARMLSAEGGPPLGILPDLKFPANRIKMRRGDSLLLCTDGITESRSPSGELFGEEGVLNTMARARSNAAGPLESLVRSESRHRAGAETRDDQTLLLLRWL